MASFKFKNLPKRAWQYRHLSESLRRTSVCPAFELYSGSIKLKTFQLADKKSCIQHQGVNLLHMSSQAM